jgi:hypothetical protein
MSLTNELAAQLDTVALTNANGFVEARIGFALEIYFLGGEMVETRLALCEMLREYHALFSDKLSHYLKVDANKLTKITGNDYLDYYEGKARSLKAEVPLDASIYGYPEKLVIDEPTPISMSFTASGPDPLMPLGRSHVCAYFPAAAIAEHGYELLLNLAGRWAGRVRTLHGGAGYSILFEHGIFSGGNSADRTILPPLTRYPGLDFSDPPHFEVESDLGDGLAIKSINWLTILGNAILQKAGGEEHLKQQVGQTCRFHDFGGGVIIQAGEQPQIGDANRGLVLDDYRRVNEALRPVRFEEYRRGLFVVPAPLDSMEETLKWVKRFDPSS